jgi:hypothetical protein
MDVAKRPPPAVIHIRIDQAEPLAGTAEVDKGDALAFEGWMGLIRAVAALLGSSAAPPQSHSDPAAR